ncbi:hypothetical protein [Undibacterium sp. RuRC25W]|uniref:hypothetical protein n=1 Tax=Undibacterium sp. RuRC25W TaxID=3413047 RepID=UPI003BF2B166
MANQPIKIDPIRKRYYRPLEVAESYSNWLFYLVAALSISALVVERAIYPRLYDLVQGAFVVGVLALFFIGLGIRLYWTPRAEDKRRQDLLSNSFVVPLTHEQTSGYYNNDQTNPFRRLCASLLENSFFSKNVSLRMAHGERIRMTVYTLIWIVALLNRATDLALAAAMAQVVFSEQIISKWIRLECLRMRFERIYDGLYRLVQTTTNFDKEEFRVCVLEAFGEYETGKGYGGITLSAKVFEQLNPTLSDEWPKIKHALNL